MDLNTISTVLLALAPSLTSVAMIIAGVINIARRVNSIKPTVSSELEKATIKLEQAYKDISILKTKVASMEKMMREQKEHK